MNPMLSKYPILVSSLVVAASLIAGTMIGEADAQDPSFPLNKGDHIAVIGNTLADRMQHDGWLETYLQALHPDLELTFRNLGFSGDEVNRRPRSESFGDADQWLTKVKADVVFCFFGYNEALRGLSELSDFEKNLVEMIDQMRDQKYNGTSPPRLVVCSPIAHQNLYSPNLPDGSENNEKLAAYTDSMKKVCEEKGVAFVDLFTPTKRYYTIAKEAMTINGIHLTEYGNRIVAGEIVRKLFPGRTAKAPVAKIREAVLDKNYQWFSRYRVVDGYNVYGGRSKLAWNGQSNADVMQREMEIFDIKTENRDKHIWAIAKGVDSEVDDSNLPEEVAVETNKQGPNPDGSWPYLGGVEAIEKMQVHEGMEVNLFASEEKFPRLVNPVQMAVDTDSRLWVSVWPSYPHWNPVEPRRDAIVILPDEDGDGEADELIVFADELNSVTGFEFWNGGVLVAAPPEIWFLKDTDGDDKADQKIRMLQGVSSADTHHSANAVVIGPDGWMYWSRGIFNIAAFETPTTTFRSGKSGVHRFNPRTFEFEFHFPIGPNPHGDVIDRWGFQFANDGTGGTGSYVNIGKGIANKQWFEKRVRPVAATGILSGSHFPDAHEGNFLICNTIGFLGVLQHEVKYSGADITATEIDPILVSSDANFRPSDCEVGGDGALYVADWHNTLIGHMQHNMRDPNRDHEHGRIYRVTATGRQLSTPAKMKGKPIAEVCENFFAKANSTRYRARLELSGRDSDQIAEQVQAFADGLNPRLVSRERDQAQALLESLWVFEEHRIPNMDLLSKVLQADEPRVRAAAVRTLGHWAGRVNGWEPILQSASQDNSPLVRAEAVKAAVEFAGEDVGQEAVTEAVFEVASRDLDPELDAVLKYSRRSIDVDKYVKEALADGRELSPAALAYALKNASTDDLVKLGKSEAVSRAILSRESASQEQMSDALAILAETTDQKPLDALIRLIESGRKHSAPNVLGLGKLLASHSPEELASVRDKIESIAIDGETDELKRLGYAAWVAAAGPGDAFVAASESKVRLRDFLDAVPIVDQSVRGELYDKVQPLISELPTNLQAEAVGGLRESGIQVEYYYPSGSNVAMETLDKMEAKEVGIVPQIVMDVPQKKQSDGFALRFTGNVLAPQTGNYTFHITSDDGSRIYLNDKLLIDNDGLHGMIRKKASIDLSAGSHKLVVTYFDNGGGDGLQVQWQGPGFERQAIAADKLSISGGETLHDVAIRALMSIPGHDTDKFNSLATLIAKGKSRESAIAAVRLIPEEAWPENQLRALADNLVGYLSALPARMRTGTSASNAIALTKSIAAKLSESDGKSLQERLENLDVRVIAIGTVFERMIYDKEVIAVQAGKPVEFRFSNTDAMPHNFAIVQPGSLEEVGELAEATGRDADAMDRHYIPVSDKVMLASKLLQTGESQALSFDVPTEPGVYPYVCTYPGHWRRMYGALYVVADLEAYQANPEAYLASTKLEVKDELLKMNSRSNQWTYDDLAGDLSRLMQGRSFSVGKSLFKVASCTGCHKLNDEGNVFGPDLALLDEKKLAPEALLRSIIEPSREIDEKFQSRILVLEDGRTITGMVTSESDDEIQLVVNPLAKDKPTTIDPETIEAEKKSEVSLMPKGLLDRLTREEILDLIGYVHAKGDEQHKMYEGHDHDH